jgi:hypothetical protein
MNGRSDVREWLRAVAEEVHPTEELPASVRKRIHRRQGLVATTAGLVAAALFLATLVTVRSTASITGHHRPLNSATTAPAPCSSGWHAAAGAAPAGDYEDRLLAISGTTGSDVWAVGQRFATRNSSTLPLIEHWNGHVWSLSRGASGSSTSASLESVSAVSPRDVWAVGKSLPATPGAKGGAIVEHWNGSRWAMVHLPVPKRISTQGLSLESVVAGGPSDVWILGHALSIAAGRSVNRDVFFHWDGTEFESHLGPTIVDPVRGTGAVQSLGRSLDGSVLGAGGWMVGPGEAARPGGIVLEEWDGKAWIVVSRERGIEPITLTSPVTGSNIFAIGGGSFTTVGTYGITPSQVVHWDGARWNAVGPARQQASSITSLLAVSGMDVFVAGNDGPHQQLLLEQWNGARWRRVHLGPAASLPGPEGVEERTPLLSRLGDGSVMALDTQGLSNQTVFLWLHCA